MKLIIEVDMTGIRSENRLDKNWSDLRKEWTRHYHDQLGIRLAKVLDYVKQHRTQSNVLLPHFESCIILINQCKSRPELLWDCLQLVDALHPWPIRWGKWESWSNMLLDAAEGSAKLGLISLEARWLAAIAELHFISGRLQASLSIARQAISKAGKAGSVLPYASAASVVVRSLSSMGMPQEAYQEITEHKDTVARLAQNAADQDRDLAIALLDQELAELIRRRGDLIAAQDIADNYVDRLANNPNIDSYRLATALRNRATISWAGGRYFPSIQDLQNSANIFHSIGDPLAEIFSIGNLGLVYYSMGKYVDAEDAMRKCILAGEELNAQWRLIRDIGNLGGLYLAMGNFELAAAFIERHLDLARQMEDVAEIARARGNWGGYLIYINRFVEALPLIKESLHSFEERNALEGAIATTVDLSLCKLGLGQKEEATNLAHKAFHVAREINFPTLHIITSRCLAEFLEGQERVQLLEDALTMAKDHGRRLDEAGCYLSLSVDAKDADEQNELWSTGCNILYEIGAEAWLESGSKENPPLVAMLL